MENMYGNMAIIWVGRPVNVYTGVADRCEFGDRGTYKGYRFVQSLALKDLSEVPDWCR